MHRLAWVGVIVAGVLAAMAVAQEEKTSGAGGTIDVRVVGIDGKPVERSLITLWRSVGADQANETFVWNDPTARRTWRPVVHLSTGDHGAKEGLSAGDYRATAALGHYGGSPLGLSEVVHLDGTQQVVPITVQLEDGPALEVRVVDAESGKAVEGIVDLVRADGLVVGNWASSPSGTWAKEGQVRFAQLSSGVYTLGVKRRAGVYGDTEYVQEGGPAKVTIADVDQVVTVKLRAVQLPQAEIEKRWPWAVFGKVTGEDGGPVAGAEISVSCGMGTLFRTGHAVSAEDGSYLVRFGPGITGYGVGGRRAPMQAAIVGCGKPGHFEENLGRQGMLSMADEMPKEPWKDMAVVLPGKPYEVNFVLFPAAQLQGQLLDEKGEPVAKRGIEISGKQLPPGGSILGQVETDEQGRFRFEPLPTGYTWKLQLQKGPAAEVRFVRPGEQRIALRLRPGGREMMVEMEK